jgi:hypothetical protein
MGTILMHKSDFLDLKHWIKKQELSEMASLLPQTSEDHSHPERVRTSHLDVPVYAPTVYHVLMNRDKAKYPAGMTVEDITQEIIEKTELRTDGQRPGDPKKADPSLDIKAWLKAPANYGRFKKGLNSMLCKSPDFHAIPPGPGVKGRSSTFLPTPEAEHRGGGVKALNNDERQNLRAAFNKLKPQEPGVQDQGEKSHVDIVNDLL